MYVNVVGDMRPPAGDLVRVKAVPQMGWAPPWPWYPRKLPHWGLASSDEEEARAWFAGVPQGQEARVFESLLESVQYRRRVLSPMTMETLAGGTGTVHLAVLTTPG